MLRNCSGYLPYFEVKGSEIKPIVFYQILSSKNALFYLPLLPGLEPCDMQRQTGIWGQKVPMEHEWNQGHFGTQGWYRFNSVLF